MLISGFGCTPEMAAYEFEFTKRAANKQGGVLAHHLIQSFKPGEVDNIAAHEIGKQLAALHLGGEYEYVLATHVDLPKTTFIKIRLTLRSPAMA